MAKIEPPLSTAVGYGVVVGLGFLFAYVDNFIRAFPQ
jgi:hypothetical protein